MQSSEGQFLSKPGQGKQNLPPHPEMKANAVFILNVVRGEPGAWEKIE